MHGPCSHNVERAQVIIANFNADAEQNKPLAKKFDVQGYPTLKFFPKGSNKVPEDYDGGRSDIDLVKFLNKKTGASRAVGGGLDTSVRSFSTPSIDLWGWTLIGRLISKGWTSSRVRYHCCSVRGCR